jgi:hypothetical protein
MRLVQTIRRHPRGAAAVAAVAVLLGGLALYWFAPWNLFIDRTVDEAVPQVAAPTGAEPPEQGAEVAEDGGADVGAEPSEQDAQDGEDAQQGGGGEQRGPVTRASGGFGGLEHATTGSALVIELEDGSRFLRLEDLETSNGPDLRVIITDQPVSEDWHVWDDGEYIDLGPLKGNIGSSNYQIPRSVDLDEFRTAVIWCRRFSVGFGVAPLGPAT